MDLTKINWEERRRSSQKLGSLISQATIAIRTLTEKHTELTNERASSKKIVETFEKEVKELKKEIQDAEINYEVKKGEWLDIFDDLDLFYSDKEAESIKHTLSHAQEREDTVKRSIEELNKQMMQNFEECQRLLSKIRILKEEKKENQYTNEMNFMSVYKQLEYSDIDYSKYYSSFMAFTYAQLSLKKEKASNINDIFVIKDKEDGLWKVMKPYKAKTYEDFIKNKSEYLTTKGGVGKYGSKLYKLSEKKTKLIERFANRR
jgi:chromosome segregation ATPase